MARQRKSIKVPEANAWTHREHRSKKGRRKRDWRHEATKGYKRRKEDLKHEHE